MATREYKHIISLFEKGDLMRIKNTGEVLTYESGTGGANFSSYVVVLCGRTLVDMPLLWIYQVEKVDKSGVVIDDFDRYAR